MSEQPPTPRQPAAGDRASADARYRAITRVLPIDATLPEARTLAIAARTLQRGGLVAFPTETVYGLGANAQDEAAVARIFSAKMRPASDPLIVHIDSLAMLKTIARDIPDLAYTLADAFWPGALTFVLHKASAIPGLVTAGTDSVAVRLPSGAIARALITAAGVPVAAPSANTFSRPSATRAEHVLADLGGHVDLILDGGATPIGVESTIIDLTGEPVVLRPGGVSLEQLRAFLPNLALRQRLADADTSTGEAAPGQMLKHYSPRATLVLYDGEPNAVRARMRTDAQAWRAAGEQVGALITDEALADYAGSSIHALSLGSAHDLTAIAAALFDAMRVLDERGVTRILAHGVGRAGLGAAIWDRLLRAAEGHVINVG